jgi:death-on-curing protein
VIYLDLTDLLHIATRTLGSFELRDVGLLEAAAARPQAIAYGQDAYPTLPLKAAALLHSIARSDALVDGNKRLALSATMVFLGINGTRLALTNDAAFDLVYAVAAGQLTDLAAIAAAIG